MNLQNLMIWSRSRQIVFSLLVTFILIFALYFANKFIDYKVVALILLVGISIQAILFKIGPVLISATLSALLWNFLFIPPTFTFHIHDTEDTLLFLMYFVIALINAVLTFRIKAFEKKVREKEEGEKLITLYNTIINSLSHELRTPISTVIGSVDTLLVNEKSLPSEIRVNLLLEIEKATNRLNIQIDNLLNMSRIESGSIRLKTDWIDSEEFFHALIHKIQDFQSHQWLVSVAPSMPLVKIDNFLVEQACLNILRNAIQYTPANTTITIQLNYDTENVQIDILDEGKGFPPESIPLIFNKFYRLPNSSTGGTGLGLSIAKGFIQSMGGTILLENSKSGGAHFMIKIPAEFSFLNNLTNPY